MKESTARLVHDLGIRVPALENCVGPVGDAVELVLECYSEDHGIIACGNGGSAADSLHIVGELCKAFALPRPISEYDTQRLSTVFGDDTGEVSSKLQRGLRAMSLVSESALITAYSNDVSPDYAFAQQVYTYGRAGDVLVCISTSGNSKNVVLAAMVGQAFGLHTLALTGGSGGRLAQVAEISIVVPEIEVFRVQELHLPIYHTICLAVENELFGGLAGQVNETVL